MSKVKRYYIGRNRDHEKVMTEITDNDKRFIKIPDDEWVRATDYDEAAKPKPAIVRPTDLEILAAVAIRFSVTDETAAEWLRDWQRNKAKRAARGTGDAL